MKNITKRIASFLLALAVVFAMTPVFGGSQAYAEDEETGVPANAHFVLTKSDEGVITNVKAVWDPVEGAREYHVAIFWKYLDDEDDGGTYNVYEQDYVTTTTWDVSEYLVSTYAGSGSWYFLVGAAGATEDEYAKSETLDLYRLAVYNENHGPSEYYYMEKNTPIGPVIDKYVKDNLSYDSADGYYHYQEANSPYDGDALLAITPEG